jgi:hypothetical protein
MKKYLLILIAAFAVAGCSTVDNLLLRPKLITNTVPAQMITLYVTNTVPQLVTNTVVTVDHQILTNTVVVTNTLVQPVILSNPPVTIVVTNGFELAPAVTSATNTVGTVTNFALPGFGSLVSNALLAVVGLYAAARGSRYQKASEVATSGATALVKAIEATRVGLNSLPADKAILGGKIDSHLLEQIETAVGKTGDVAAFIAHLVENNTGNTTGSTLAQKLS